MEEWVVSTLSFMFAYTLAGGKMLVQSFFRGIGFLPDAAVRVHNKTV
jgi:hypothetical protein